MKRSLLSAARPLLVACLGFAVVYEADAQWSFGPVGGIDIGPAPNITAAIGYARPVGVHDGTRVGEWGFALGTGIGLDDTHRLVPQIGFWWEGFFAVGLKAAGYMHSGETALVVVPEIGLGVMGFRLVWSFPGRVAGPWVEGINRSQVSIYYFHPLNQGAWD